ncbi:MAG: prepilin-type N-terminal cleavage/methylation domain-containing protein [Alphaproteobacteria bacterium]|nr:prepilin-type N-terminal cleavage/methylation domain-containing protein [Alphaproteobacteria bacterium]
MKKTFSPKKSAFSLIELSIVLIIIGLLIAGVTGGASLIKSSELRAAISEARGWATAVNGFYNQYQAFPGDYINSVGTALGAKGNGNSQINAYTVGNNPSGVVSAISSTSGYCGNGTNGTTATTAGCSYEDNAAWSQLRSSGVIDTNVVSNPDATFGYATYGGTWAAANAWSIAKNATFGTTNPQSKIKSSGWVFDYNTTSLQNVVVLTGTITAETAPTANSYVNGTVLSQAAITPADALSIDTKVDDGVANTGRVRAVLSTCNSTGTYTTSTTSKACALSYQVDLNS